MKTFNKMHHQIKNKIVETETIDFGFEKLGGVGDVLFHYMKKHGNKAVQVSVHFSPSLMSYKRQKPVIFKMLFPIPVKFL